MIKRFILYLIRWQLSTPILWLVVRNLGTGIESTIIANLIGATIFFWVDRFIFTSKAIEIWHFREKGICDSCGKETSLWRLVLAPNYDRRQSEPKFFCRECSKKKTDELRKKGIPVRGGNMKRFFSFLSLFVFLDSFLFGAHPLITDDAKTVEQSNYELEVCYEICKILDDQKEHSFGLSFKHGVTNKMDIGVFFPFLIEPGPIESFGPASIGLKFSVIKELFAFSVNNQLGSSEYFLNGIFSQKILPIILHLNLGYHSTGDEKTEGSVIYGSAFEFSVKKFDMVTEFLGDKDGFQSYLFGFRYNIVNRMSFSLGYGNGLNDTREKITTGFRYEF